MSAHVSLSPEDLGIGALYDLLAAAILPRPIALVSTKSSEGKANLAPFSFFMPGGSNPPSLAFSPTLDLQGREKDTLANVRATREFTVNIVDRSMAAGMNSTAVGYPKYFEEWLVAGLTPVDGEEVSCPRVLESPAAFECRLFQIFEHGAGPGSARYVVGEIVRAIVREDLWEGTKLTEPLRTIGRLGGSEYIDLLPPEIFVLPRPTKPPDSSG